MLFATLMFGNNDRINRGLICLRFVKQKAEPLKSTDKCTKSENFQT